MNQLCRYRNYEANQGDSEKVLTFLSWTTPLERHLKAGQGLPKPPAASEMALVEDHCSSLKLPLPCTAHPLSLLARDPLSWEARRAMVVKATPPQSFYWQRTPKFGIPSKLMPKFFTHFLPFCTSNPTFWVFLNDFLNDFILFYFCIFNFTI